jgi:hypothetical protein
VGGDADINGGELCARNNDPRFMNYGYGGMAIGARFLRALNKTGSPSKFIESYEELQRRGAKFDRDWRYYYEEEFRRNFFEPDDPNDWFRPPPEAPITPLL